MIYFELFEIPVQLRVNTAALSRKFFELSRKYHPDYVATEDDATQTDALEKSALVNKAWKTLQSPEATMKYVLQEKGLLEEEEKYALPPAFLMEMMELNESLMEADDEAAANSIRSALQELDTAIYSPVKDIVEQYQEGVTTEKELLAVKEYYYKKKYLDRIRQQLTGMA